MTGDLVDGSRGCSWRTKSRRSARCARATASYFVTGNHDHYSGANAWVDVVGRLRLTVLRNRSVRIERDGAAFTLAGVDDHRGGFGDGQREDLPQALAERDPALPVVLLAHDPGTFKRASQSGVDLQLSGHTHGGQIWPFHHLVRLATPFVAGRYTRRRGRALREPRHRLLGPAHAPVRAGGDHGLRAQSASERGLTSMQEPAVDDHVLWRTSAAARSFSAAHGRRLGGS